MTTEGICPYEVDWRPRTTSIPLNTNSRSGSETCPVRSRRSSRSTARRPETLATESCGRPVESLISVTLPGDPASLRLPVKGTQRTVRIRLRLNALP